MDKQLVTLSKNVLVVSTLDMWEDLEVNHKALITLIRKYQDKFQQLGPLAFEKLLGNRD